MVTPPSGLFAAMTPGEATPAGASIPPETPMPSFLVGAPPAEEAVPGKTWTRIRRLGAGGYGEVWKVRYLNSEEAWKFIPRQPGASVQAFRETLLARSIHHASIVRIQDILEEEDHFIIRMDLVRGRDLHAVVSEDGVLPPLMVCRFAVQLAGALEAAHKAGVLHLDLKPSNILLRDDGERVLITDFGIAATMNKGLFMVDPAQAAGTPYFLAPEQVGTGGAEELRLQPGVDIWALGITLYFLLSRAYPFDFSGAGPSVILAADPRPIAETVPYVDEELWSILKRMLAREPRDRFADMSQVRSAFTGYVTEITCPACRRTFPVEHVHGVCPEVNCPDPPRVVALKERRQQLRGGHHFFARCEHSRAIEAYRRVVQMEADRGETGYSERAARLITIAEADGKALARRIEVIRGLAGGGDLLRAIKEVDRARTRFSAAADLVQLRRSVLEVIRERYENVVGTCSRLVKETRFADAKLLLTQVEGFLGYEPVQRSLKEWEQETARPAPPVQDLYNFVDERENFFGACQRDVARYLGRLRLDRAAACLQRLEKHFPNPEERAARIRRYSELQESFEIVQSCDPVALSKILDAGEGALPPARVELVRAEMHCRRLLEGLAEDKPEGLSEIVVRREGLEQVLQRLRARIEVLRARFEAAERDGRLREQEAALAELAVIADRTDLLDIEEVARIRALEARVADVVRRAEEKYREGLRRFEQNDFSQAQITLEAAARIAPGLFPDIPDRIAELRQLQEENQAISEQTYQVFNRIMGEKATLDDFRVFVRLSQQDAARHEQETMVDIGQKAIRMFARLFAVQGGVIAKLRGASERLAALRETMDIVVGEPEAKLAVGLLRKESNLNEQMLEFFGRVLGPLDRSEDLGDVDSRIDHLRSVIAEITRFRSIVKLLKPLQYHPHPAERASAALVSLRTAILESPDPRARFATILAVHDNLAALVQDEAVLRQIARSGAALRRALRRLAAVRLGHRLGRFGRRAAIPVGAALAVGIVLLSYFHAERGQDRRGFARDVIRPTLSYYGLTPEDLDEAKLAIDQQGNPWALGPLLVVGRGEPLPEAETTTLEGLGRWIEGKHQEKAGLEYLAGIARKESLARIEAVVARIGDAAEKRIRRHLAGCLQAAVQAGVGGDLRVDLAAAGREMRALARLAKSVGSGSGGGLDRLAAALETAVGRTPPAGGVVSRIEKADQWEVWRAAAVEAMLPTGFQELDRAFLELVALADLGVAVRSLTERSRAIFWSNQDEDTARSYVEYVRAAVAALAAFGDHLREKSPDLFGRLLEVEELATACAIERKVWAAVRTALKVP